MRRRIRYRSRAAAWCMTAFSSFCSATLVAGEVPTAPVVEEAAPYLAAELGMPAVPVTVIQPVEFNPVVAPRGGRMVLADAEEDLLPPPLPTTSMPRLAPPGADGSPTPYDVQFRFVQQEGFQPSDVHTGAPSAGGVNFGIFGGDTPAGGENDGQMYLPNLPDIQTPVVSRSEGVLMASVDTGELVSSASSVSTQRRAPVSFDPHIRGYRWGQIYVNAGAQWAPVRPDLDSVLSKIDPDLIREAVVIPGPYGLRYGPGLSFMDIILEQTPRYFNGPESHARVGINYRGNGDQTTGRVTAYGGGADYGYIMNYTVKTGIDYQAGDGSYIPSSYNVQNYFGQIGFDLSPDSRIDLRYVRVDQNDTEYAGQFFDLGYSGTDAATVNYVNEDFGNASRFIIDGWYNYSRYAGDTNGAGKRSPVFPVIDRVERGLTIQQDPVDPTLPPFDTDPDFSPGDGPFTFGVYDPENLDTVGFSGVTRGDQQIAGTRAVWTFGEENYTQMDVGVDFRYRLQTIVERYSFRFIDSSGEVVNITNPFSETQLGPFTTNLPRSNSANPGVFWEIDMPFTEYWTTSAGARVDYAYTTAYMGFPFGRRVAPNPMGDPTDPENILNNDSSLPVPAGSDLERSDWLYAFYLTNEIELSQAWTGQIGFGHSQRPPTLIDRYADGLFLGIFQSGFSRVIGNPNVDEERAWQIDVGLDYDGYNFRGRVSLYHSWIIDYITYSANTVGNLPGAYLYQTLNTSYATLGGFEAYGEYDLSDTLQVFGAMSFVEGRDHGIDQPLPGISPFEGTLGVRLVDRYGGDTWGAEFGARMVHEQERIGAVRSSGDPTSVIVIEQRTPGFTTLYVRGYYNVTDNLHLIGGVENLGDRLYQEHLDLRLPASDPSAGVDFSETNVWAPGITPYIGVEATY